MTSLNGDNSWLLSFPRPSEERVAAAKVYYHIVMEPWLAGPASQLSSWFIHISLTTPAAVPDNKAVEAIARQIEDLAVGFLPQHSDSQAESVKENGYKGDIDAILLGFHYLDHLHEPSLRLFDKRIPVVATPEAAKIVNPWGHFDTVDLIHDLDPTAETWHSPELHPDALPSWITAIRLPGHHELNFCWALIWSHISENESEVHEAIIASPHGTRLDEGPLMAFVEAKPATRKLAMLHGLKESHTATIQTTLGAKGGLALYRRVGGVKYWMLSHHSRLAYAGIFMRLVWTVDTPHTLDWALLEEGRNVDEGALQGGNPHVVEVENGGCFVLRE
ncbi:Fc.00g000330.m01.CDS01 [Cosmosporella sp. VM-42]